MTWKFYHIPKAQSHGQYYFLVKVNLLFLTSYLDFTVFFAKLWCHTLTQKDFFNGFWSPLVSIQVILNNWAHGPTDFSRPDRSSRWNFLKFHFLAISEGFGAFLDHYYHFLLPSGFLRSIFGPILEHVVR